MVSTVTSYTDSRNRAYVGAGYDGVVKVSVAGYYGTGALLFDGRAVLTAAHLFTGAGTSASVTFETAAGMRSIQSSSVLLHPDYDEANSNHDVALVWLADSAPLAAERYALYRGTDEIGKAFTLVGYGQPGTGSDGTTSYTGVPMRLKAGNSFDADGGTLKSYLGAGMAWDPAAGTQLIADFDDGTAAHDALGRLIYRSDTGLGTSEGVIAPGDSGGPAFIDGKLAGIAAYGARLSRDGIEPDVDDATNGSFGEIAGWQRASHYQQWIDQALRAHYPDAPTKAEDVKKQVAEGDSGTGHAFFLLRFTGVRADPEQIVSVDYATRDGTAVAGQDYLAASGTLNLYSGEDQAAIPVEIVGDELAEANEYFYLDVTNPVGGSFGAGIAKLTAVKTILDDDGMMA